MVIRNQVGNLIFQSGSSGALLISTNNYIGIGTSSPSNLLTIGSSAVPTGTTNLVVNGNIGLFRNRLCFNNTNSFSESIYNNNQNLDGEGVFNGFKYNGTAGHWFNVTSGNTAALFINSSGMVGIGNTSIVGKLNIYSNITPSGTAGDIVLQHGTNGVSCIVFPTANLTNYGSITLYDNVSLSNYVGYTGNNYSAFNYWSGTSTEVMALVIGIGTATSNAGPNSIVLNPNGNVIVSPGSYTYLNGNVGIGVTNPTDKLYVAGSVYVNDGVYIGGTASISFTDRTNNLTSSGLWYFNDLKVDGYTSQTSNVVLNVNGNIGTTGSYWLSSDIRIKTNIEPVHNMLQLVEKINVVSYEFIDQIAQTQPKCSAGLIAQQVQQVFPESVSFTKEFLPNIIRNVFSCQHIDPYTAKLTFTDSIDVKVGDIVRYFVYQSKDDATEYKNIVSYVSDDNDVIHVPAWPNMKSTDRITIYGTQVDNFHNIDKLMITMLMAQGAKELDEYSIIQQTRIHALQSKLFSIKQNIQLLSTMIEQRKM
jgi:hypothetical protein